MATFSDRLFGLAAFVTLLIGVALFLAGFSLPYWMSRMEDSVFTHAGLWQICTNSSGSDVCSSLVGGEAPGYFRAVQGLEVIALIGFTAGIIFLMIGLFTPNVEVVRVWHRMKVLDMMTKLYIFIILTAGMCSLVALILYGTAQVNAELDYAYFLHIVSLITLVFTMPLTFFDWFTILVVLGKE